MRFQVLPSNLVQGLVLLTIECVIDFQSIRYQAFVEMASVTKGLLKSVPVVLVLSLCVALAGWLEAFGIGGVVLTMAIIVVLVFVAAVLWAYFVPWSKLEFLISLSPVPAVVLVIVAYYSGFTGRDLFNSFNLFYVALVCLVIGVPWLAGSALGSYIEQHRIA